MTTKATNLFRITSAFPGLSKLYPKCMLARHTAITPPPHRPYSSTERHIPISKEGPPIPPTNASKEDGPTSTVDAGEVNKFKPLGGDWWHPNGSFKLLHSMNDLRVPFIREGIAGTGAVPPDTLAGGRPLEGVAILDVGCGGGILAEPLARMGATVTGLDAAEESIQAASAHNTVGPNLSYICGTIEDHSALAPEKYDAVVASEVLEHVSSVDNFLEECSKCLKPGGSLFVTTMNRTPQSYLGAIVAAEYLMREVPVGTHDWNKFVKPQHLAKLLRNKGFSVRMVHGMLCFPPANRWCWVSDTSINYAMHAVKAAQQ